jgi:hypothetical protein
MTTPNNKSSQDVRYQGQAGEQNPPATAPATSALLIDDSLALPPPGLGFLEDEEHDSLSLDDLTLFPSGHISSSFWRHEEGSGEGWGEERSTSVASSSFSSLSNVFGSLDLGISSPVQQELREEDPSSTTPQLFSSSGDSFSSSGDFASILSAPTTSTPQAALIMPRTYLHRAPRQTRTPLLHHPNVSMSMLALQQQQQQHHHQQQQQQSPPRLVQSMQDRKRRAIEQQGFKLQVDHAEHEHTQMQHQNMVQQQQQQQQRERELMPPPTPPQSFTAAVKRGEHSLTPTPPRGSDATATPANTPTKPGKGQSKPPLSPRTPTHTQGADPHLSLQELKARPKQALYRTEMCVNFVRTGRCKYANKCMFAHSAEEIQERPRLDAYHALPCPYVAQRSAGFSCSFGNRCNFAHVKQAIRKPWKEGGFVYTHTYVHTHMYTHTHTYTYTYTHTHTHMYTKPGTTTTPSTSKSSSRFTGQTATLWASTSELQLVCVSPIAHIAHPLFSFSSTLSLFLSFLHPTNQS